MIMNGRKDGSKVASGDTERTGVSGQVENASAWIKHICRRHI